MELNKNEWDLFEMPPVRLGWLGRPGPVRVGFRTRQSHVWDLETTPFNKIILSIAFSDDKLLSLLTLRHWKQGVAFWIRKLLL